MTNPDMIHAGILPHHAHWARTFQKLRYVVLDELHTYRGVFGSHVAHVIARLRRAARFHGSDPVFLCATATIGNPREHAARLLGVAEDEVALVDESGAPTGARRLFVYNPPVVNAELGIRASTWKSAVSLAADLVRARVPTIVFGQSRNGVEVMLKYLRDKLARRADRPRRHHGLPRRLPAGDAAARGAGAARRGDPLRGGHQRAGAGHRHRRARRGDLRRLPRLGRRHLAALRARGAARGGERRGAGGRRARRSTSTSRATPETLFDAAVEAARIDPHNTEILIQHLKCAAFELPFVVGRALRRAARRTTRAARCASWRGTGWCTSRRTASTGRPTPTRPTT